MITTVYVTQPTETHDLCDDLLASEWLNVRVASIPGVERTWKFSGAHTGQSLRLFSKCEDHFLNSIPLISLTSWCNVKKWYFYLRLKCSNSPRHLVCLLMKPRMLVRLIIKYLDDDSMIQFPLIRMKDYKVRLLGILELNYWRLTIPELYSIRCWHRFQGIYYFLSAYNRLESSANKYNCFRLFLHF